MRSLYVEGDSLLHRTPAGLKLALLAVVSMGLFATRDVAVLAAMTLLACVLYWRCGMGWRAALSGLRPIFLMICAIALFHLVFSSWQEAAVALFRLSALMLAAATVTATTRIGDFIDTITTLASPLERLGLLRAADVGLAVGLVVRFVPEILSRYEAIRDAHRARGVPVRITTLLVPLVISTLREADAVADAIDARGLRRHNLSLTTEPERDRTIGKRA